MDIALSFTLVIMATITLMLGLNVVIYDDMNQRHNQYYIELCGASSIWSFSYACVGLMDDLRMAAFARCFAFIGVLFVLAKGVVLVSIWMDVKDKWQKAIYIYVTVMSLIIYPQIIDKSKIVFVDTPYGHFFTFKPYFGRTLFNIYIVTIAVITAAMLYHGFHSSNKKRLKKMAKATMACITMLITGMVFDVIIPLFGVASFPSSSIMQFFSVVFVYFIAIRYNVSRITIANVSEYIYSVVDTPILVLDGEEKIQLANTSSSIFLQVPVDQIIGKRVSDFFITEEESVDNEKGLNVFAKCVLNESKCDLRINDIKDRYNEYLGKIVVVTDMTDRINLIEKLDESREEAVQANQAKSAFLANMSHEIRTPMNTIVGMSELLLRKDLEGEVRQEVLSIRNAGNGLLYIINDILDISKIESGKFEIIDSQYMLASLIVDVVNMMAVRLVDKGIYLLVNIDNRLPANLIGDDLRIKQILINIIGNAIKFTHKGYISVSISGKYKNKDELAIIIKVEDTGIGIKQEDMSKLFGIFNQVDTRKNRKITGTGLGLAISKDLSELMGGSIEVESEYGKGTTFTIQVQQRVIDRTPVANVENKEKILIVLYETDPILLKYFAHTFDEMGLKYFCISHLDEVSKVKNYTHFLIRNENMEQIADEMEKAVKCEKIITIVEIGEESNKRYSEYCHIYLPLFTFQLINILNDEQVVYTYGKTAFDARQLKPMPFARVLIVDDNETNLHVAKGLMSTYRMKIDTASSGYDALSLVKVNTYDMIFMDHMMPELDGVDTTKRIRQMEGEYYKTVPIVALTANAMSGARESFISQGFDDFLAKPMEYKELNRVLREFVLPHAPADYRQSLALLEEEHLEKKTVVGHIAGIEMQKKLEDFGGNTNLYHSILHTYLDDIKNRKIEIVALYEEQDMHNLLICIHAVKSASYSVGANQFGKLSEQLEMAIKKDNREYIKNHLNKYMLQMDHLITGVESYIREYDKKKEPVVKAKKSTLSKEDLLQLKVLCEEMELEQFGKEIEDLLMYSYEPKEQELLENLRNAYDNFEYEEIVVRIEKYLK